MQRCPTPKGLHHTALGCAPAGLAAAQNFAEFCRNATPPQLRERFDEQLLRAERAVSAGQRRRAVEALGRALAAAVAHVHECGLAHGSIRPSNIMLAGGAVRITDLGLGRLYDAIGPDTPYRAPERGLSPAADVYSLGSVLYHALTGRAPDGERPEAPGEVGALLAACQDPDPTARPTAAELHGRLGGEASA